MAFGATVSDSVRIGGGIGNVHRNAPSVILQFHLSSASSACSITDACSWPARSCATSRRGTYELFFSRRRSASADYLLGRFLAAFGVAVAAFLGVAAGHDRRELACPGSTRSASGRSASGLPVRVPGLALPNLLLTAATFFTVCAACRGSMLYTYLGGRRVLRRLHRLADPGRATSRARQLGGAAGPVRRRRHRPGRRGTGPSWRATRRCLPVRHPPRQPPDLARCGAGDAGPRLARASASPSRPRRHGKAAPDANGTNGVTRDDRAVRWQAPRVSRSFSLGAALRQLLHQTRLEVVGVLKSVPFPVILAFGMFNLLGRESSMPT